MTDDKRARLEAAIDEDPYDPRAYAVLADYLQEIGDPIGELIALQLDGRKATNELAAAEIIAKLGHPPGVQFHYARGYARSALVDPGTAKGTKDALAHPSARFLFELRVAYNNAPLAGTINAIAAARRPTLRVLQLGRQVQGGLYQAEERELGDMSALWAAVPRLEELELLGNRVAFGAIDAPQLRTFDWSTSSLSAAAASAIAKARLPALQDLAISCVKPTGTPEAKAASRELGQLLARDDLPALTHLSLERATDSDKLIAILATSPLLKRLTNLELAHSDMTDTGAQTIMANAGSFAHVSLNLMFNEITSARAVGLQELFPTGSFRPQSLVDDDTEAEEDEHYDDVDE